MKLKCIVNGSWLYADKWYKRFFWSPKKNLPAKGPNNGDVVTLKNECWHDGVKYYCLVEWPNTGSYNSKYFVPIEEKYEEVKLSAIKEKASVN